MSRLLCKFGNGHILVLGSATTTFDPGHLNLVEFQSPERIRRDYPGGVREMSDGGTWDTIAGQPSQIVTIKLINRTYGRRYGVVTCSEI